MRAYLRRLPKAATAKTDTLTSYANMLFSTVYHTHWNGIDEGLLTDNSKWNWRNWELWMCNPTISN